jgi:hypothetical protein
MLPSPINLKGLLMNLEEIRKAKLKTEAAILQAIRDFKDETGLSISDINFTYATEIGKAYMHSPASVDLMVYI